MKLSELDDVIYDALKDFVGGVVKTKLIKMGVDQATRFLFARLPFLAWGPLGYIVTRLVTKGVVFIVTKTIIGAQVLYIYGDTTFDKVAVRKIITKFKELEKEGMTDEQRKKLDIELAEAGRELIRYGTL